MSNEQQSNPSAGMQTIPAITIGPVQGLFSVNWSELWQFRELLYFLTWRDIKVRYKQTTIGVAWALLQPLAMMAVFSLFFGKLAGIPSEGIPYPLFAFAGLLPWQMFSRSITDSTNSLVSDQKLISKVFFPRVLVPTAVGLAAFLDFGISMCLLALVMAYYGVMPGMTVVWLPFFILMMLVAGMGVGYWLSALNVEYRDVMYTVPFLNQFWMFLTPVVYPSSLVPEQWRAIYGLNPMVGVVEGFRWCLFGIGPGPSAMLIVSILVSVFLFVSGLLWFSKRERTFVDSLG